VAYWVAARHLVPAAPFFLLALAWALDRLARFRPRPGVLAVSLLAMGVAGWPLAASVYGTSPEVVDSYDPAADHSYLAGQAGPHDLVFFNTVARAGWYEALRGPAEASWALALRWEPIVEPLDEIVPRIQSASATHRSLWFALYNGSYGTNGPLVDWLDANLFPAAGSWQGDTLYSAYVAPRIMAAYEGPEVRFEEGIRLVSARYTAEAAPGGACAVELTWAADGPVTGDYKVFVHAADAEGRLVTQHDAVPGMGQRPVSTWAAEEAVLDRHGLLLPPDLTGPLEARLQVGLYSAESGERLRLPDGSDHVDIGACTTRGE